MGSSGGGSSSSESNSAFSSFSHFPEGSWIHPALRSCRYRCSAWRRVGLTAVGRVGGGDGGAPLGTPSWAWVEPGAASPPAPHCPGSTTAAAASTASLRSFMAVGAALGPIRALPALAPLPSALQGHHRGWGRWDGGSPSAAAAEPNPHPVLRQQLLYGAAFSSALCAIRLVLSSRGAAEPSVLSATSWHCRSRTAAS